MNDSRIAQLVEQLRRYNEAYRAGRPEISDHEYDELCETLRELEPNHPYLHTVEAETVRASTSVRHRVPMLSTEKAYEHEQLERFVERVHKAAKLLGVQEPLFRLTPKLDGMAGKDVAGVLASRGNGLVGNDISHIFKRGVVALGGRDKGAGEIVMVRSYFESRFSDEFEHPRNMVAGIVNADEINPSAQEALDDQMVHFVPYSEVASWEGSGEELLERIGELRKEIQDQVDYPLDGMVAESTDDEIKSYMGSTTHHHRWQIAIKTRGETATTRVLEIQWQTGRTGKITPVLKVEPTKVSGATISSVTAHHAGMVRDKELGVGAVIEIIRSGEVIPKLVSVIQVAEDVCLPESCPSCASILSWDGDFLRCANTASCPEQTQSGLRHWFKILGNSDGFGPKTIDKLVAAGFSSLPAIYAMIEEDFRVLGFGDKQSENLVQALNDSRSEPIEDARFLAAFGINNLGLGDSRKLLRHHRVEDLGGVEAQEIDQIKGFGDKTSVSISKELSDVWPTIQHMLFLGFQLERTVLASEEELVESPISGKVIMFTGKMVYGDRSAMQDQARQLGATVLSSVSSRLEILVIGQKPSNSKVTKASGFGAEVLSEDIYRERLGLPLDSSGET